DLVEFGFMIRCANRNSQPAWQYMDYGCYCGKRGSGTPVDDVDRCCQTHNECYDEAAKIPGCKPKWTFYFYQCGSGDQFTCRKSKDVCRNVVCDCDFKAALCLTGARYNSANYNIDIKTHCR
nr:textilotoxin subunit B [Pseudonaja textilis=Australian common brown snake, venom, Peptide, 121 aa] [Pseudonaja textilis]